MTDLTAHVRVLQPHPGLFAFHDGRIEGQLLADGPNRLDEAVPRRFAPHAAIHRQNVARTLAAYGHG
ncbi:MAG: hypothetical protein LW703_07615 [Rhodobacter sp.]|jgi:hypothetical protein|nr:hypothetical protein [Rhodobacter sp.]